MQVEYGFSDDYALLRSGRYEFYYGYETDWHFVIKDRGREVFKLHESDIQKRLPNMQGDSPKDFLLCGIALWNL